MTHRNGTQMNSTVEERERLSNNRPMRVINKACIGINVIRALIVRSAFLIHMLFIIWAASCVTGKDEVWIISILVGLLILEAIYSVVKRQGREPKWFSPCIFVYLLAVVPAIWILNIDLVHCRSTENNNRTTCNGLRGNAYVCSMISVESFFDRKPMVYTLEEIMMLLLIVGKWLLPRGTISMNEHSQLLLIYFGLSFDILDLLSLFDEKVIISKPDVVYVILVLFTVSLFQFTIVLTVVRRRRPKLNPDDEIHPCNHALNRCCMSELWSLSSHILLHDGPFMVLRLICLINFKILTYNFIFFTVKNVFIVILELYRYFALILKCHEEVEEEKTNASVYSLPQHQSSHSIDQDYNGSFYGVKSNPNRSDLNRSKYSLNNTGMTSQEINFETNV